MQNLRNKLIAGGAVVILATIGTVMNRQAAQAQGGPTVTIAAPLPLPVRDISKSASQHVTLNCPQSIAQICYSQSGTTYVVPAGQNLVVTSVDILGLNLGGFLDFFLPPPLLAGQWAVPADGLTHSFQYPSGIVFPAGYSFSPSNVSLMDTKSILQGFLTPN
jgi:hypothetical protein